jgi:hypothetical protein
MRAPPEGNVGPAQSEDTGGDRTPYDGATGTYCPPLGVLAGELVSRESVGYRLRRVEVAETAAVRGGCQRTQVTEVAAFYSSSGLAVLGRTASPILAYGLSMEEQRSIGRLSDRV